MLDQWLTVRSRGNPHYHLFLFLPFPGRMGVGKNHPSRDHWQHRGWHHIRCPTGQYPGDGLAEDLPVARLCWSDPHYL